MNNNNNINNNDDRDREPTLNQFHTKDNEANKRKEVEAEAEKADETLILLLSAVLALIRSDPITFRAWEKTAMAPPAAPQRHLSLSRATRQKKELDYFSCVCFF